MTLHRSRRGLALLAAVATLGGGALTAVATAAAADTSRETGQRLLGLDLELFRLQVAAGTIASVQTLIAPLSPVDLADALQGAAPAELTKLLAAADLNGQLDDALSTMTPTQVGGLLASLTGTNLSTALGALTSAQLGGALATLGPGTLTTIVGGLTPGQITGLLGAGAGASLVDGLLGAAAALGATPGPAQVDGLVGQVTALLGGGIPASGDQAGLASLLGLVNPLLSLAGVDTMLLGSLKSSAEGLLAIAPAPLATPLQEIVTTITAILVSAPPPPPAPAPEPAPGGTTTTPTTQPGTAIARPAVTAPAAVAKPGPYRATIGKISLSKPRTSMKFTLSCPRTAPIGCLVRLGAKIAGQKAMRNMMLALPGGRSTNVTVTLSKSTARRLRAKGGTLRVTATTALSTLGSMTQSVKVEKPEAKRRTTKRRTVKR